MRKTLTMLGLLGFSMVASAATPMRSVDPEAALKAVRDVEPVQLRVPSRAGVAFQSKVHLNGAIMTLDLAPYSVRAKDFKVVVIGRNERRQTVQPGPVRTVKGTIREIPGSVVVGSVRNGGLEASILLPDERVLSLSPVARSLSGGSKGLHSLSVCGSSAKESRSCGLAGKYEDTEARAKELQSIFAETGIDNCATQGLCVANIIIDTDSEVFASLGSISQVQTMAEDMIAQINPRYAELKIRHELWEVVIRSDPGSDPYVGATTQDELLGRVHDEWSPQFSNDGVVDLVHLVTDMPYLNGAQGAAYTGRVCSPGGLRGMYSYSHGANLDCGRIGVLIHELGHSWGGNHSTCGMMHPLGPTCTKPWCGISLTEIPTLRDTVDSMCLDLDSPPTAGFEYNCTGLACAFTSTAVDDKGIASQSWSFGDSSTGSGATPSHTYAASGRYPVQLTVTDTSGQTTIFTKNAILIFADVPPEHWARSYIEKIYNLSIDSGCDLNPREYCPDEDITRAATARFLLAGKEGPSYTPPACVTPMFSDVPCSHPDAAWINEFAARGISAGCGGGNFCPNGTVDRGTMAYFLLITEEGMSYTPPACVTPTFTDVPCSQWYAPWVEELVDRSVASGCGSGNYCPDRATTRAEAAAFVVRTFGL